MPEITSDETDKQIAKMLKQCLPKSALDSPGGDWKWYDGNLTQYYNDLEKDHKRNPHDVSKRRFGLRLETKIRDGSDKLSRQFLRAGGLAVAHNFKRSSTNCFRRRRRQHHHIVHFCSLFIWYTSKSDFT